MVIPEIEILQNYHFYKSKVVEYWQFHEVQPTYVLSKIKLLSPDCHGGKLGAMHQGQGQETLPESRQ